MNYGTRDGADFEAPVVDTGSPAADGGSDGGAAVDADAGSDGGGG
jgi:hypothetical protein